MEATIVDLRYRMNEVLKALDRNEKVTILYRGKPKGVISPARAKRGQSVREHPFFGMKKDSAISVEQEMENLRGGRYRDL